MFKSAMLVALIFCALFIGTEAQKPSPCPDIFIYEPRNPDERVDRWAGKIYLTTEAEIEGIWLHITLDRPVDLLLNWFSDATSQNNKDFTIRNSSYVLKPGESVTIKIAVIYNAADTVPNIQNISLNGRRICFPGRPVKVTTISPTEQTLAATTISTRISATSPRPPGNTSSDFFRGDHHLLNASPEIRTSLLKRDLHCGVAAKRATALIQGGRPSIEGAWPWHVALYISPPKSELLYICGGTLVTAKHVVTAAHCVAKPHTKEPNEFGLYRAHLGQTFLNRNSTGMQSREIVLISIHPYYNYTYFHNDVAVLKLSSAVNYTDFIRPACLWQDAIGSTVGKIGTVVGWGFDERRKITDILQEAKMPVADPLTCIYSNPEVFNKFTSKTTYCAGYQNGTSVCNGDSGGGMFFPISGTETNPVWQLGGIVSVSLVIQDKFCDSESFAVFTDVSHFLPWINSKLKN